ncbi:DUF6491 family protein [Pseudoxanthomonas suwonensis]|uniref:Lipoprotein n=1 Tax=Pseudoxanthomonas suwonensis TaxID=314722 RepID=A0A0E3UPB8_9GAMM|nr:DUF6491 family protein [Pseudoxanthomonas suwonensis]AKC87675.1 hypothetical protein WQ53_13840 [Pseudoxanthomonas suwonensis]
MKRLLSVLMLAMVMTVGLGACSSTPRATPAERLAFYEAHAGEPVRSFRLFGRLNGWTPLGNNALVVWTRPNEAWLLDVTSCQDLQFAVSISISNFANTVTAGFDTVTPHGPGMSQVGRIPCRITQIRPIDTRALNQSREEIREANSETRTDPPPAENPPAN